MSRWIETAHIKLYSVEMDNKFSVGDLNPRCGQWIRLSTVGHDDAQGCRLFGSRCFGDQISAGGMHA